MRLNKSIRRGAAALALAVLAACVVVSPYDEVIDKGIVDFAEQLNTFVKNMADAAGKPDGTYEANTRTYNALDSKLDVLIARADIASDGQGCKVEKKVYDRISQIMAAQMPPELKDAPDTSSGNADGCNSKLLRLVKEQLATIRQIHATTDKCGPSQISCLRPATAGTALKIANQSINAVSVVEAAKRRLQN